jgi:hypothetical protein
MLSSIIRKSSAPAALAAVLCACAAPAHALAIISNWDPLVGASFPGVSWSGSATFDVPAADLLPSFTGSDSSGITVTEATVSFSAGGPPLGSVTWKVDAGDSLPADDVPTVTSMTFTGGKVSGITTTPSEYFQFVPAAGVSTVLSNYAWALSFVSLSNGTISAKLDFATCEEFSEGEGQDCTKVGSSDVNSFPAVLKGDHFAAAVPEPQTYALMFAGLAALGFVARRRRTF